MVLTTLAHDIDVEFLREAYRRTRKGGAAGVDGQTAASYEQNVEENPRALLGRFKAGTYRAPPGRRVHIPKGDGSKTRAIAVPTFEDKVLQRAVCMRFHELLRSRGAGSPAARAEGAASWRAARAAGAGVGGRA